MFARVFALLPLALLASASTCSTEDQRCCNSLLSQNQAVAEYGSAILSVIDGLAGQVGVDCTSIAGNACSQQAVCCQNVVFNGALISAGCNAISA